MSQGNNLQSYIKLLEALKSNHIIAPIKDFKKSIASRTIYLRHDIDHDIECAYDMSIEESKMGIKSTYYALTTDTGAKWWSNISRRESGLKMLLEMQDMGHEIGIHYDIMGDWFVGKAKLLAEEFSYALNYLRDNGLIITTCAAHGSGRMQRLIRKKSFYINDAKHKAGVQPYAIRRELNGYRVWKSSYSDPALIKINGKTLKTHSMRLSDYELDCEAYVTLGGLVDIYAADARVRRGIGITVSKIENPGFKLISSESFMANSSLPKNVANNLYKNTEDSSLIQLLIHPHHWRIK